MFLRNKKKSSNETYYPINKVLDGLVYSYGDLVFLAKNQEGYKFYSDRALASWGLRVHPLNRLADSLPRRMIGTVGFRDGTLIQNAKDGKIYVISAAKRVLLTRPLGDYGFDWADVIEVADDEVQFHLEGGEI